MAREYYGIEKGLQILGENSETGVKILFGSADPSTGGGVTAEVGSLYLRTNGNAYKKINTNDTDWEILPDQTDVAALITLSGVAAGSVDLGTFTGITIPDGSTVKAALQALETALEAMDSEVVRSSVNAVQATPTMLDEVLVDDYLSAEWLVSLQLDSDPAKRTTRKIVAHHDGTTLADAANVADTQFAILKPFSSFVYGFSVVLSGTGATQKMQLLVNGAAGAAVSARATRINVKL